MLSRSQVDKVGEKLKRDDVDATAITLLEEYRSEFQDSYKTVERQLRDRLGHEVTGRPAKSTMAISEKLKRQSIRLSQIQDIAGCRVIVPTVLAQDSLGNAISVLFDDVATDDKRERPTNGYRALHLIAKIENRPIEIQVRTDLQHVWADVSERLADVHGQGVKYGKGDESVLAFLTRLSSSIRKFETAARRRLVLVRAGSNVYSKEDFKARKKQMSQLENNARMAAHEIRALLKKLPELGVR